MSEFRKLTVFCAESRTITGQGKLDSEYSYKSTIRKKSQRSKRKVPTTLFLGCCFTGLLTLNLFSQSIAAGPKRFGSGFIITNDGYVLTCWHVIKDSSVIKARFDNNFLPAKLIYKDLNNDLALLKISGIFPALAFSTNPNSAIGQAVFTIGYPNPKTQDVSEQLSRGMIISTISDQEDIRRYQVDVPIQPGNSGGPLLDAHGNVIGVVAAMISKTTFKEWGRSLLQNINFAVSSRHAQTLLNSIPEASKYQLPAFKKKPFEQVADRVKKSVVMVIAF